MTEDAPGSAAGEAGRPSRWRGRSRLLMLTWFVLAAIVGGVVGG
jgi:hypothetical protein